MVSGLVAVSISKVTGLGVEPFVSRFGMLYEHGLLYP